MTVDLLFPAAGGDVPTDHAYPLLAALSAVVPGFHAAGGPRFAPLTGDPAGPGRLRLGPGSRLRVRVPDGGVRGVLPLAGRRLDVFGCGVRLGAPAAAAVVPAAAVAARLVTFKHAADPERFLATARTKLAELGVAGEPAIPLIVAGPRAGEPRRRVVRVKGRAVVGYALVVSGLSPADAVRLQDLGLGGRTRLGCGFFLPVKEGE